MPNVLEILSTATNSTSTPMSNFLFQVAVPKTHQLQVSKTYNGHKHIVCMCAAVECDTTALLIWMWGFAKGILRLRDSHYAMYTFRKVRHPHD